MKNIGKANDKAISHIFRSNSKQCQRLQKYLHQEGVYLHRSTFTYS